VLLEVPVDTVDGQARLEELDDVGAVLETRRLQLEVDERSRGHDGNLSRAGAIPDRTAARQQGPPPVSVSRCRVKR